MDPLGYGVATSAYQIEGAVHDDGRGDSIWDVFTCRSGVIRDGSDARVACDSYHRLADDLALLELLGVSAYRFSVSWPRVQPEGCGPVNPAGLAYYDGLVDALLARSIRPMPTLYHWDLPQPLEDAGGWPARPTVDRFADYAALVAAALGDRVQVWATHNEPWCTAFLGYASGVFAPGRRDDRAAFDAAHHLLLSHALGAEAVRAQAPAAQVGMVLNLAPVRLEPDGPAQAARIVDAVQNGLWLQALAQGRYPAVLPQLARHADGLDRVRGSADWIGVNYYTPFRIGPAAPSAVAGVGQDVDAFPGAPPFTFAPRPPLTTMGWEVDASGLAQVLRRVAAALPGTPLRVSENGAAFPDDLRADDGSVLDQDRIDYLRDHLAAVAQVRSEGVPVLDYLAWSLLDNFEWAQGYTQTFGLAAVEPGTLRRRPKASFRWYADQVRRSAAQS